MQQMQQLSTLQQQQQYPCQKQQQHLPTKQQQQQQQFLSTQQQFNSLQRNLPLAPLASASIGHDDNPQENCASFFLASRYALTASEYWFRFALIAWPYDDFLGILLSYTRPRLLLLRFAALLMNPIPTGPTTISLCNDLQLLLLTQRQLPSNKCPCCQATLSLTRIQYFRVRRQFTGSSCSRMNPFCFFNAVGRSCFLPPLIHRCHIVRIQSIKTSL